MSELICRGIKIHDDPDVITPRIRGSLENGSYERPESVALRSSVRDNDVVLELGAGVGYLSAMACVSAKNVRAYCYEAHPGLIPIIRKTHELNGISDRTEVYNAVLTPDPVADEATFYLRHHFWSSSLDAKRDGVIGSVSVPNLDLNAEVRRIKPTVVVCDIEGAEADLIPKLDVSGVRLVVLETHPAQIGRSATAGLIDHFHAQGLLYDGRCSTRDIIAFSRDED